MSPRVADGHRVGKGKGPIGRLRLFGQVLHAHFTLEFGLGHAAHSRKPPSSTWMAPWSTPWVTSKSPWRARWPTWGTAGGRGFIARTVGKGSEHLIRARWPKPGRPSSAVRQAWARYQHHYLAINGQHSAVFEGVIRACRHCAPLGCGWPA
jgi:hypothetical protein